MAKPHNAPPVFTTTPYSPVSEHYPLPRSTSCFGRLCCGWGDYDDSSSHNGLLQVGAVYRDSWLVAKLKKLKEYSEVTAGPKWKNFVRRAGKVFNPGRTPAATTGGGGGAQFQYSPQSYALNFEANEEDGRLLHSFSSRYVSHSLVKDQHRASGL